MTFRYDPFNHPATKTHEAEQQRYYFEQLIRSLEAKLQRVDPLTEEYEETVDTLFSAQEYLKQAAMNLLVISTRENQAEAKNRGIVSMEK